MPKRSAEARWPSPRRELRRSSNRSAPMWQSSLPRWTRSKAPVGGEADLLQIVVGNGRLVRLDPPLRQRLLHVLHTAAAVACRTGPLADVGAQLADAVRRTERAPEQAEAHQPANPLAVQHVALAPADLLRRLLRRPRIHQMHLQACPVEHLEHRDPVHARRLQRDDVHTARRQPRRHRLQIVREPAERPNRALRHRLVHATWCMAFPTSIPAQFGCTTCIAL